ncbi:Na+/H+ antiporter NhaC family protein [Schnuerera sp. xch1]|uniref:Na+/H+ antiporter NhaC family protein n=1 Tax=Schnuerera sp. xch1 TaxID=2874283 RepID=UPI001CBEDC18|nr:Na+/H+ antiporter NhaC family protein [Schnuerera sp. xch1]MBZ2174415.1 Na+/H+ antiporter NhaC family protein [Schnuerera sp. xch1]
MITLLKLSPIFLLAGLMMGSNIGDLGLDIVVIAPIATIYAAIIAYLTEKITFNEIIDAAIKSVKGTTLVIFILMFAYAMAEVFMSTGVGAAIINIALGIGITGKTVAVTSFFVTAVLSVATGTSWGTFAACAPIFLWLNHIVGGDIILTIGAIAGGSCFGDNIGLISDTTVISSSIQDVEVIHRIRHQGVWSILCLILAAILFFVFSLGLPSEVGSATEAINQIPEEVWTNLAAERPAAIDLLNQVKEGVPYYMILPLIIVLGFAIKGLPTLTCLFSGLLASYIFGMFTGTVESTHAFLDLIYTGFTDAGSWVIVMMVWINAFGGIMSRMQAFKPLSQLISKWTKNVRQLMFANGVLSILGNAALADELAQIVTIGPIIRNLTEENIEASEEDMYTLRLRNATFSDALAVFGSQLIPWHVYIGFYVGIATAVYPLHQFGAFDIIKYNFISIIAIVSILLLTLTGWDRFIPLFRMPAEPDVQLKKNLKNVTESK